MIRIKNKQYNILGGFLGWMWFALIVIPIYYIVVTSLRDQSEIYSENPLSLPQHYTFAACSPMISCATSAIPCSSPS